MKAYSVFCGSNSGQQPELVQVCRYLGGMLAARGIALVYGGAQVGLMGALAEGAKQNGGYTIGVLPQFLQTKEIAHPSLDELHIVDSMHERKALMYERSEGIIMLPGGFGTLEEFFEMLTWAQLGLHQKPIGILNAFGYYDALINMFDTMETEGFITPKHRKLFVVEKEADALLQAMDGFISPPVKKWIQKEEQL